MAAYVRFWWGHLALLAVLISGANAAVYTAVPQSTAVLKGSTVIIPCSFSGLSGSDVVVWEGPPNFRTIATGRTVFKSYHRHRIVGDVSRGEFNLEIRRVTLEDGGGYRCTASSADASDDATVTVIDPMPGPPELTGGEYPVTAGSELMLRCRSRGGHPVPTLSWYNGTHLQKSTNVKLDVDGGRVSANLAISRLEKWDNGVNMTCVADQGFPKLVQPRAASRTIRVNYPPSVLVPEPSVHIIEGASANLTCAVDSNPSAIVSWRRHGDPLPLKGIESGQSFLLSKVSRHDAGVYQCTADNSVSPPGYGTVTLDVLYPPWIDPAMDEKVTVLNAQDDFTLECLAEGKPKPTVKWRRKDTSLYWENPLRFHRVRYDLQGTYECIATSQGFKEVKRQTFIDVVGKPHIRGSASTTATVARGGAIRLVCDVVADPLPNRVKWVLRNNEGIEEDLSSVDEDVEIIETKADQEMSSSITVKNVGNDREGTYLCKATNMFGTAHREIQVDLTAASPQPMTIIVVSVLAVVVLVAMLTLSFIIAVRKGWICDQKFPDPAGTPMTPRPMPPAPKYAKKTRTGTNDSGVEDLMELQELDGTLKPRPPPRADKEWTSVGLSYPGLVHSSSLPPYSTVERDRPDGEDTRPPSRIIEEDWQAVMEPPVPPPKDGARRLLRKDIARLDVVDERQPGSCEIF
ncbi:irregular chiasm C-roughest protein-like isoform X1 [Branchiostoma lanceolatum]|uniref:irregular chiasm C-roughest protein-like isoform X1 n=1 Tax=Branchiostoma lanceolatum TaxID=7740 RepID=UPI003451D328